MFGLQLPGPFSHLRGHRFAPSPDSLSLAGRLLVLFSVDISIQLIRSISAIARRVKKFFAKVMYVELQKRCNPTPPKADRAVGHYIFYNSSYATFAKVTMGTWTEQQSKRCRKLMLAEDIVILAKHFDIAYNWYA